MTLLSVVERELRVSSRRTLTYWGRVVCAGAFILLAFGFIASEHRVAISRLSHDLFTMLSVVGWFGALLVGVLVTADCISSEKRDGTLGLLFLTDLRAHEIILGKLAGNGVNALLGLAAALPVLALPVLMGGVSGGQFFEVETAIVLALLYAMSLGIMVSTLVRSSRKAYVISLCLALFLTIGLVALEGLWLTLNHLNYPAPVASRMSPFVGFMGCVEPSMASRAPGLVWQSFAGTALQILVFWFVAVIRLPRVWQEKASSAAGEKWRDRWFRWSTGEAATRKAHRAAMLDLNPICWLDDRHRLLKTILWSSLVGGLIFWAWLYHLNPQLMLRLESFILTELILNNVLVVWLAIEVCQRFADDRRSGAFELLLGTTLSVGSILSGRILAVRRQFAIASFAVVMAEMFLMFAVLHMMRLNNWWQERDTMLLSGMMVSASLIFLLEMVAVTITGLWASLTSGSAVVATIKTLVRVVALHWLVFLGVVVLIDVFRIRFSSTGMGEFSALFIWFAIGVAVCGSAIAINLTRLHVRMRLVVSEPSKPAWWERLPGLH